MRKLVLLLILLLIPIAIADITQQVTINLTIENQAPRITSLTILPQNPYYDSELECKAVIHDERAETVEIKYSWYVNGVLIDKEEAMITQLNDNDIIKCEAIPIDEEGVTGNKETANTTILPSTNTARIIKPVLNFIGIGITAEELTKGTSMNAVTGMITGQRTNPGITLLFILSIFAMILISLNVLLFIIKKIRSPKQD